MIDDIISANHLFCQTCKRENIGYDPQKKLRIRKGRELKLKWDIAKSLTRQGEELAIECTVAEGGKVVLRPKLFRMPGMLAIERSDGSSSSSCRSDNESRSQSSVPSSASKLSCPASKYNLRSSSSMHKVDNLKVCKNFDFLFGMWLYCFAYICTIALDSSHTYYIIIIFILELTNRIFLGEESFDNWKRWDCEYSYCK